MGDVRTHVHIKFAHSCIVYVELAGIYLEGGTMGFPPLKLLKFTMIGHDMPCKLVCYNSMWSQEPPEMVSEVVHLMGEHAPRPPRLDVMMHMI